MQPAPRNSIGHWVWLCWTVRNTSHGPLLCFIFHFPLLRSPEKIFPFHVRFLIRLAGGSRGRGCRLQQRSIIPVEPRRRMEAPWLAWHGAGAVQPPLGLGADGSWGSGGHSLRACRC